jgi:hypothetical protein
MDRWLLLPVIAAALWAQETAPAAAEAEKALRARVDQFYTLQVQKKFRQAEAFVAEDTKDFYYNSHKTDLLAFSVTKVEMLDNNTKARVTVSAKATMMLMGAGRLPFESPAVTLWKIENGAWVWYIDQDAVKQSPFGQMRPPDGGMASAKDGTTGSDRPNLAAMIKAPDLAALQSQVKIDRTSVVLTAAEPVQTATISNGMPGFVDVTLGPERVAGVSVEIDKTHLAAGEKAAVRFRKTGSAAAEGSVHVSVSPLNTQFDVRVKAN